ncbi:hypothetical protein KUTeg_006861 [Tegillarca granosa]|uniref:Glucose-methanol-choline oxidoreductase N-terminal domain-containing protein n=1 Tax=Tegillarca granosa TaxID=220873 RepID=A0ABQ9FES3_TEGGR|nr:hypothetical protein KUTeg_006861 [Tegillarca granosa]
MSEVRKEMNDGNAKCMIHHEGFIANCLNRHVLKASFYEYIEYNGRPDEPRTYRHIAYRRFVRWIWGFLGRKNRKILPSCAILINKDRRAYGVKVFKNGQEHIVKAFREVIVSGGAFETPKLLQLSGVGPTPILRKFKLRSLDPFDPPLIDPKYLQNNNDVRMMLASIRSLQQFAKSPSMRAVNAKVIPYGDVPPECNYKYPNSNEYWACVFRSKTIDGFHPAGTCRMGDALDRTTVVDPELRVKGFKADYDTWESLGAKGWSYNDVFPYFLKSENNKSPDILINKDRRAYGVKVFKNGQEHIVKAFREVIVSGGVFETPKLLQLSGIGPTPLLRKFKLRSLDPFDPPLIDPKYLQNNNDVRMMLAGIRSLQQFAKSPSMRAVNAKVIPNGDVAPECNNKYPDSDVYWACVFRSTTVDGLHPAGTCRMGDARARTTVVDSELSVSFIFILMYIFSQHAVGPYRQN